MSDPYERRYVVAGMLSTIEFTPAEVHPGNMLPLADRVIRYVQLTIPHDASEAETPPPSERRRPQ